MRRAGGTSNATFGAIALVVLVAACYLGFTKAIPFRHHFELRAVFRTSNDIRPNSPVRIAGVNV
ncbi:MAG: phospholipid/cholesterol/gamma-HCH transport system substrate-binding protein, partial [Solirubrobacteraceae bacterium]|nr:phospholipid/cholesterol/gamma-HCH transport system substrate-binding protein [Solirubrobacteraceae bacterium]